MLTYENHRIVVHRRTDAVKNKITREDILRNKTNDEKLLSLPCNDSGNARRFLLFCWQYVKYNKRRSEWLYWNGRYWDNDAMLEIRSLATAVMERYYHAAIHSEEQDKNIKKEQIEHSKSSNNYGKINNLLKLAECMNYVPDMKCKPHMLNVANGVLNLKTKKLHPHSPKYGCTTICEVKYDASVHSMRFRDFLDEIFLGNQELIKYVQTMFGYGLTAEHKEEKIFFLYGSGSNGKSKLIEAIRYVTGKNSASIPITALTKAHKYSGQPTPELVPLLDTRLAFASEIKGDDCLNDSTVKQLTGNKTVQIRKMRREFSEAEAVFKIFVDTNFMPYFKHYDYAVERRVIIIPFRQTFTEDKRDPMLSKKLKKDKQYILRWLVDGAYEYYQNGLREPKEISEARYDFRRSSDSVGSFIIDKIKEVKGSKVKSSILHKAYEGYCYENDYEPLGSKGFSQEMQKRGFRCKSENSANYFQNIKIN